MRTLIAIALFLSGSISMANYSSQSKADLPYIMKAIKKNVLKLKNADSLQNGIRQVGHTRPAAQIDEVLQKLKPRKNEKGKIKLTRAMFFSNKVELTFGYDTVVFEIVDANRGDFKINNKSIKLTPQMTFKQVFDATAKVMGHRTTAGSGIPFIIPAAHAGFFRTLLKVAGIGILAISAVDLVYVKTHGKNKAAISEAAAQCEGYVTLQKAGNAPSSTPTSVKQLEQLIFAFKDVKEAQCGGGVSYVLRASLVKAAVGACGDAKKNLKCLETYAKDKSHIDPDLIKLMIDKLGKVKPAWTNDDESNNSHYYLAKAKRIEAMGPGSTDLAATDPGDANFVDGQQ